MDDTDKSSGDDPMLKHRHVDTNKTIDQLEKDHGETKSPDKLASEAFKDDADEFKTPEEIAAAEDNVDNPTNNPKPKKEGLFSRLKNKNLTKKQKIILIVLLIVVLLGLLAGAWMWKNKKTPSSIMTVTKKEEPPKPTTEASKLTGRQVAPEVNQRQVTAVMIENSPDARPQSGLLDAGVVFEAIAEGGVTRFVALYQDTAPDYIGPIRSARPYYAEWILGFDASYAHVGGSPDALALIKAQGVKDLDQFSNAGSYDRVKNRFAPHNVYTSIARLDELEKSKGYSTSNFTGFERKEDAPLPAPVHNKIDARLSGFNYNPHWDYDKTANNYARSMTGKPHTDERTGAQLRADVVVVMVVPKGIMADGYHTTYQVVGNGKVFIYQDGNLSEGIWEKKDDKSQITFKDSNGQPIRLNSGITWLTAVGGAGDVSSGP